MSPALAIALASFVLLLVAFIHLVATAPKTPRHGNAASDGTTRRRF